MSQLTPLKVCFVCFLDLFAASLVVPLLQNYFRNDLHLSHSLVGMISSTFSLLQIISAPTVGYLSDVYGRRLILLACLFTCVISYFLLGICKHIYLIVTIRIVLGLVKHTQVIGKAFISDICSDSTQAYSQLMGVTFIGFFVGPALGGHVISYENGFFYICCISSCLYLVSFGYTYYVVYDYKIERRMSTEICEEQGENGKDCNQSEMLQNEIDIAEFTVEECAINNELRLRQVPAKDMTSSEKVENSSSRTLENSSASTKNSSTTFKTLSSNIKPSFPMPSNSSTSRGTTFSCINQNFFSYVKTIFSIDWFLYWDIFALKFVYATSMSLFYMNYMAVLQTSFRTSPQITGYSVSFQGLVGALSNMFLNIKNRNSHFFLFVSFLMLSISIFGLYLSNSLYFFMVLLIPLSISSSLVRVLCLNITMSKNKTSDSHKNRNGHVSGIYNNLTSFAKVISPILSGVICDVYKTNDYKIVFFFSFVISLFAVALSFYVWRNSENSGGGQKKEE